MLIPLCFSGSLRGLFPTRGSVQLWPLQVCHVTGQYIHGPFSTWQGGSRPAPAGPHTGRATLPESMAVLPAPRHLPKLPYPPPHESVSSTSFRADRGMRTALVSADVNCALWPQRALWSGQERGRWHWPWTTWQMMTTCLVSHNLLLCSSGGSFCQCSRRKEENSPHPSLAEFAFVTTPYRIWKIKPGSVLKCKIAPIRSLKWGCFTNLQTSVMTVC